MRRINGALPIALEFKRRGAKALILPEENARAAAVISDVDVFPVKNLIQIIAFLNGELSIPPFKYNLREAVKESCSYEMDFSEVKGQEYVKRALGIAAAGSHNIFMLWSQYHLPV